MLKLMKFLRKSVGAIIIVILLLGLQAYCDLSLPTYTSDIVNTGIMKNGIKSGVPTVIRKSEFDKITMLMTENEKSTVLAHYTLMEKKNYSEKEWSDYLDKYPI
jgi:ATP-binding cassette subfamily B protein